MAKSKIKKNIDLDILDYYDSKIKNYVDNKVGTGGTAIHYGTTEYWNSQPNLIGEKSHIYVYTDYAVTENDVCVPNIKIGDGNAFLVDNPFVTTSVEELLQLHIDDNTKHITEQERSVWNNKVRCYLSAVDGETIVFTTN